MEKTCRRSCECIAGALIVVIALCTTVHALPQQTPVQRDVVRSWLPIAAQQSEHATAVNQALFSSPALYKYLEELDDGSMLYKNTPAELSARFWEELSTAELVHSFGEGVSRDANCGFDLTVTQGLSSDVFYNQWELQSLNMTPVDASNNRFTEYSEVNLFHFPPFSNVSQPDLKTSASRPFYMAINMYRGNGGNPQCGPITAVVSRQYFDGDAIVASPVDTGFWTGVCSQGGKVGTMGGIGMCVCDEWPAPRYMGVPPYTRHLLRPYLFYYNQTQDIAGDDYPSLNLARLLLRLLSRNTYKGKDTALPLNFVENVLGYFEFNAAATLYFPSSVKMMIGMFELLWGTEQGNELRLWCVQRGWPLVWAFNPEMSFWRCGPAGNAPSCTFPSSLSVGLDSANTRLLDPLVLQQVPAGSNMTIPSSTSEEFEELWSNWSATDSSRPDIHEQWYSLYDATSADLAVEPLFYGACQSAECIGVRVSDGACVCRDDLR